ncbi:hypothetical protein G6F68_010509 [Rhizopus microsporus]|nr:hypothetical protein G6F68_010509 [Rhizopus microsporus]
MPAGTAAGGLLQHRAGLGRIILRRLQARTDGRPVHAVAVQRLLLQHVQQLGLRLCCRQVDDGRCGSLRAAAEQGAQCSSDHAEIKRHSTFLRLG